MFMVVDEISMAHTLSEYEASEIEGTAEADGETAQHLIGTGGIFGGALGTSASMPRSTAGSKAIEFPFPDWWCGVGWSVS